MISWIVFFKQRKNAVDIFGIVLLVLTVFLVFSPVLRNGFVNWDDPMHVLDNPQIRSLDGDNLKVIFTSTQTHGFIPLTIFSFALEYHFFGLNPFVYHLDNLILHLAVTVLLFVFGRRLGLSAVASFIAALLFGIHPMHVESVAWVTERKDVLYAFFYLLALHSYWSYLQTRRKMPYALAIVFGILSMLAKPMALSLPLILVLCDVMKGRRLTWSAAVDKIPHVFYVVFLAGITYQAQSVLVSYYPPLESVLIWVWSFGFYLWKFIVPYPLLASYPLLHPVSFADPSLVMAVIFFIGFMCVVIRFRAHRWVMFASFFYVLSILFLLRFDALHLISVADRYMYLPSAGFCLLFGVLVSQGLERLKDQKFWTYSVGIGLAVFFSVLFVLTFRQAEVWKNSFTLWNYSIEHSSDNNSAYGHRGSANILAGKYDAALEDLNRAVELFPDVDSEYFNRALVHEHEGRLDLALADYDVALQINPAYSDAYNNKSAIYFDQKRYDEAITVLTRGIALNPQDAWGYSNRGIVYDTIQNVDAALADYNQAIKLNPNHGPAYFYRSYLLSERGEWAKALSDAQKAVALGMEVASVYMENLEKRVESR